jgi:hypothetical protein
MRGSHAAGTQIYTIAARPWRSSRGGNCIILGDLPNPCRATGSERSDRSMPGRIRSILMIAPQRHQIARLKRAFHSQSKLLKAPRSHSLRIVLRDAQSRSSPQPRRVVVCVNGTVDVWRSRSNLLGLPQFGLQRRASQWLVLGIAQVASLCQSIRHHTASGVGVGELR